MARAEPCTVPSLTGRRKLVLFDMPSGTLPSGSTPRAVPIDASVSAIAAYTPPCTMPIGWHTRGRHRQVARAAADLVVPSSSTTKPIVASNASSGGDAQLVRRVRPRTRRYDTDNLAPVARRTWESYHAITTLLYRYTEYMDAADFDAVAELFADAVLTNEGVDGEITGGDAIARLYRSTNRVHDDGTLRTRHLTTNVIVDIDEDAGVGDRALGVRRVPADADAAAAADRHRPLPRPLRARRRDAGGSRSATSSSTTSATYASTSRSTSPRSASEHPDVVADARHLLVVFHSRSGATQALADAVDRGRDRATRSTTSRCACARAPDADADDVRWCDAIVLGTPENFGYMSGLDQGLPRTHLLRACSTRRPGSPTRCSSRAAHDGEGAIRSIERIVTGLKWNAGAAARARHRRRRAPTTSHAAHELGLTMAAGLEAGVF